MALSSSHVAITARAPFQRTVMLLYFFTAVLLPVVAESSQQVATESSLFQYVADIDSNSDDEGKGLHHQSFPCPHPLDAVCHIRLSDASFSSVATGFIFARAPPLFP